MQKIAVFSNMYPSGQHPTYGIFVKNQVGLLQESGLDVDVIAIDDPAKGKAAAIKKYGKWFFHSFFYLLSNRKKLSLTHSHYAFPTGLISLIGKKMMNIPYVITVHGGDIDKMAKKCGKVASLTRSILHSADAVIAVGERLKEEITGSFGVPEDKVHVMSMGVDTKVFKKLPKEQTRESLGVRPDEKIILFVGNFIEAKGLLELVEAVGIVNKTMPEAALHLIGSPKDTAFLEKLGKQLAEKGVNAVQLMPQPQAEIAKWMAASDVFVLPSHHEGFGLVALEAMACGTTVVGSDVGGLSKLLSGKSGILVEPKNARSLADGLLTALDGNAQVDEETVAQKVDENSYGAILKRLLALYSRIGDRP